jgi:hypothetical protein
MTKAFMVVCWAVAAVTIVYAIANPENGILLRGPWAVLCVGLIGLGLCRHAREMQARRMAEQASSRQQESDER